MTLVKRNQNNWLPSIFNDMFDNDMWAHNSFNAPAINVKETKNDYVVEVAAPGMTKDDFVVRIDEDNNLVISLEKKDEKKEEDKDTMYLRREFSYSKFEQTLILPENVDKEKISAKVENGVMNITLPKFSEAEVKKNNRLIDIA